MNRLQRHRLAHAAILGSMLVASACTVGPDYVRPAVDTPPSFKEAEGWKVAQPQDERRRGNWWEVFGDAQLNELAAQVDVNNQTSSWPRRTCGRRAR